MRVLLAWEYGAGLGHISPFNCIAGLLAPRRTEIVAAWGPLGNIDRAHPVIEHILPAPMLSARVGGAWDDELVPTDTNTYSFATNLERMGFADERILGNNQRAWNALINVVRPDVIIADYAPGVIIAARGRIPVVRTGNWYSIPAHRNGYLAPYDDNEFKDAETQDRIVDVINGALARRGASSMSRLGDLFPDESCFAAGFPEFDGHRNWRAKPCLPAPFEPVERPPRRGEDILVYIDPSQLRNEVLAAGLLRVGGRRVRLHSVGLPSSSADEFASRGMVIEQAPFSLKTIASDARLFIHHGGAGAAQLGALAGVPQLAIYRDIEKRSHAAALERLGIGRGIDMRRLSVPNLRETAAFLLDDESVATRAKETATQFAARAPEQNIYQLVAEAAIAAASG